MNWSNLREHKCPQCSTPFQMGALDLYILCHCGFTISLERYEEIMVDMTRGRTKEQQRDNLSELNNL